MRQKWMEPLKKALLVFVLVTIGYALGKESALRKSKDPEPSAPARPADKTTDPNAANRVRVLYMHATFRCVTCNTIEKMTRELLEREFGDALADGRIEWREVDFQENEALAKRYDVISSCVVVARLRGDEELDFKRLDKVWTSIGDPPAFNAYVGDAVRACLPAGKKEGSP